MISEGMAVAVKEQRARVYEHRFTRQKKLVYRFWIESEQAFGGIRSFVDAQLSVDQAMLDLVRANLLESLGSPADLAAFLLDKIPAANSVEVCDRNGNGCAAHRDWP